MGAYRGLRFLTLFVVSLLLTPLVGVIMLLSTSPAYRRTNGVCKACEQPDHNPVCTVCKRVLVTPIAE